MIRASQAPSDHDAQSLVTDGEDDESIVHPNNGPFNGNYEAPSFANSARKVMNVRKMASGTQEPAEGVKSAAVMMKMQNGSHHKINLTQEYDMAMQYQQMQTKGATSQANLIGKQLGYIRHKTDDYTADQTSSAYGDKVLDTSPERIRHNQPRTAKQTKKSPTGGRKSPAKGSHGAMFGEMRKTIKRPL